MLAMMLRVLGTKRLLV